MAYTIVMESENNRTEYITAKSVLYEYNNVV